MKKNSYNTGYFLAELIFALFIGVIIAGLMCISAVIVERLEIIFLFDRVKVLCVLAGMMSAVSFIWTKRVGDDVKSEKED